MNPINARPLSRRELMELGAGTLLSLGLLPGSLRAAENGLGGEFSFIVVNDLHYIDDNCGRWFERVVKQMKAETSRPEFCLVVGDWTEHGTAATLEPARDAFKALGLPVYGVIGNHDYETPTSRNAYEKSFPDRLNYHFEHRGWQFVGLDSSEGQKFKDTQIQPATLDWLATTLPKLDRRRPMVLFTHFPLGPLTPYRPGNAEDMIARFKEHNLQAVFNGHFHGFTERHMGRVALTTNKCCAISRKNHDKTPEKGYFICQAKEGQISRKFVEVKPA